MIKKIIMPKLFFDDIAFKNFMKLKKLVLVSGFYDKKTMAYVCLFDSAE